MTGARQSPVVAPADTGAARDSARSSAGTTVAAPIPPDWAYNPSSWSQRLPLVGNGFSASPIAADDKIYLPNEDGEILVISAGEKFAHVKTNSMGELLMATPALSEGVMYIRTAQSLFAVGRKK